MEIKHRLKPNILIARHRNDSSIYCPACGHIMEQVLHTPKDKKPIYLCPRCNTFIPKQIFTLYDFK